MTIFNRRTWKSKRLSPVGMTLFLLMGCNHSLDKPTSPIVIVPPVQVPAPPVGMVKVLGGTVTMGSADFEDAKPIVGVVVASFYLDITPVTGAEYQACITALDCAAPIFGVKDNPAFNYDRDVGQVVVGKERHPINGVTFQQAKHYCQVQGKRLPTEIEWEYAARGTTNHKYSWGDEDPGTTHACWNRTTGTCPVQNYGATLLGMNESQLDAQNLRGVYDLDGNVREWVDTKYASSLSATNTPCDEADHKSSCVARGGSWFSYNPSYLRSSFRFNLNPTLADNILGFRCARAE